MNDLKREQSWWAVGEEWKRLYEPAVTDVKLDFEPLAHPNGQLTKPKHL